MVVVSTYRCNVSPSPSSFPTIFTQIRQHMYIKRNTLSKRRILNFVRISLSKNECVKLTWNYAWVCQMMAYVMWLSAMMCHIFGFIMAKDTNTALRDLCQDLLTQALVVWAALLTQDNVHKHKQHELQLAITCMQPDFPKINTSQVFSISLSAIASLKVTREHTNSRIRVLGTNSHYQQCTNKCTV